MRGMIESLEQRQLFSVNVVADGPTLVVHVDGEVGVRVAGGVNH
jgi:hypothetical protein